MESFRCKRCTAPIQKKPKAKKPKYCASCRGAIQDQWRDKISAARRARTEGKEVTPVGPLRT